MHRGLRAWQTRRPCQINWWRKRIHRSRGITFIRSCSIFLGSVFFVKIEPPGEPLHVCIYDDSGRDSERRAEHNVCRLPRDAGQREQLLHRLRNLAVKLLNDFLAGADDRFRFVAEKTGGADLLFEFRRICVREGLRRSGISEKASR